MKSSPKSKREAKKRKKAADSLHGIWPDLPKSAIKELLRKTY